MPATTAPDSAAAVSLWRFVRIGVLPGCHRLTVSMEGTSALHAELETSSGWIPLPLAQSPEGLSVTFHLSEPAGTFRVRPMEGRSARPVDLLIAPASPWRSLLPDWRVGPLALPPRPDMPQMRPEALPGPLRPHGWDARITVHSAEAASIDGPCIETGPCGVLALTVDPPLPAGVHRIEGRFLTTGGAEAAVVPRVLVPGLASDPLDGIALRPIGQGRLGATLTLREPADVVLLRPREQRGRVVVLDLKLGTPSPLGALARALGNGFGDADYSALYESLVG